MKSFGLAAIMVKLGVPIPRDKSSSPYTGETRVDFFTDIFVELGDHQNLRESTYQAHLKSLSHLLERVSSPSIHSSLLLIDELGGGTDPTAGACIAQAILEKVLDNRHVRTILTTHSMQLKALAIEDNRFNSASVLLQAGDSENTRFRLPTYKLCYGTIGNSYALGAASRCDPPLPNGVLDRAASLIASSQDKRGEHMRIITEALEKEQQALSIATEVTSGYKDDIIRCRNAIVALARSYEQQFSRIESRLDGMLLTLKEDETRSAYDIVGDSLSTLRASKKYVKSKEEMLRDKGMRAMTMSDDIAAGAQVMIIGNGDFEGETATVSMDQSHADFDEVVVDLDLDFDNAISLRRSKISVTLKKSKLAVWDYPSFDEVWGTSNPAQYDYQPVQDSQNRLQNVLSTLKNEGPKETGMTSSKEKESGSNYASSRERKAAKKKSGKKKK